MKDRFQIPLDNQRPVFGVFLAAHAIPDAVDIMHTGVGCKPKAQRQISSHDRMREAQNKMVWSDVDESLLITGSADRLRDMTVQTFRRREGVGLIVITTSTSMEMTSLDVEAVLPEIRQQVSCPVIYIPTPGYAGDLHVGYQQAMLRVLSLCDWSGAQPRRSTVNVLGYLFDRYEHDHAMSNHEVRRLLAGLGLETITTFLSGTPKKGLMMAPQAEANIVLPWARPVEAVVERTAPRPTVHVDLPLGMRATTRFLEQVAASRHVPPARLAQLTDSENRRAAPLMRVARERLEGARVAILADTPMAAGLLSLCRDLGMEPVLAGLMDRSLGGRPALEEALARGGLTLDCPVLENPSATDVAEALEESGPPEILVSPDAWLPPETTRNVARVELGIPSNRKHAIYAQPVLGYRGAICMAQRLMDARAGVH